MFGYQLDWLGNPKLNLEKGIKGLAIEWVAYEYSYPTQRVSCFACMIGIYNQAIGNQD